MGDNPSRYYSEEEIGRLFAAQEAGNGMPAVDAMDVEVEVPVPAPHVPAPVMPAVVAPVAPVQPPAPRVVIDPVQQ